MPYTQLVIDPETCTAESLAISRKAIIDSQLDQAEKDHLIAQLDAVVFTPDPVTS